MRLTIVRHGQTIENNNGITQGQTHGTLSEIGHKQIKKVAQHLMNEKYDFAYSSDLGRAINTAKEILTYHPKTKLKYDIRLREWSRGIFDGKHHTLAQEHVNCLGVDYEEYRWENGENVEDVKKRVIEFLKDMISKHKNDKVLLVGHGGPITLMLRYLLNLSRKEKPNIKPCNASTTVLNITWGGKGEIKKGEITIEKFNCVDYL
jgi:broad specificity phosphatase PhoE